MITLAISEIKKRHHQVIEETKLQKQYFNNISLDEEGFEVKNRLKQIDRLIAKNKDYFKRRKNTMQRYKSKEYLKEGNAFVKKYLDFFGIDEIKFYNTREFEVTQLKIALSRVLMEKYYPVTAIADILRKHHATINYYIRQDFAYNIIAKSFYEKIKEKENE